MGRSPVIGAPSQVGAVHPNRLESVRSSDKGD
jgi:hypothetical protein